MNCLIFMIIHIYADLTSIIENIYARDPVVPAIHISHRKCTGFFPDNIFLPVLHFLQKPVICFALQIR